ncbi:MAG: ABC transporter permease [Bacteroidota bacterium]
MRKTIGSLRVQLIGQFFTESLLVAVLALVIALGLLLLALPFFNELAESKMAIPWLNPAWWIACIGFSLFTGLIAGSYPALYLSSFQPIKVLKGISRMGRSAALPRKIFGSAAVYSFHLYDHRNNHRFPAGTVCQGKAGRI